MSKARICPLVLVAAFLVGAASPQSVSATAHAEGDVPAEAAFRQGAPSVRGSACQVGGPPTNYEPGGPLPPTSEVLVVGCGELVNGIVEIVAFDSLLGLCISFEQKGGGVFSCPVTAPSGPLEMGGTSYYRAGREHGTYVFGRLSPEVATVSTSARIKGRLRTASALVVQLAGELLTRLNQETPLGYFVAAIPGCALGKRTTATAFDANTLELATAQGPDAPDRRSEKCLPPGKRRAH